MYLSPTHVETAPASQHIWDLPHLLRIARRRFRLMLVLFLAVVAVTAIVTFNTKPTYTGTVQLLIEKPGEGLIEKDRPATDGGLESAAIDTELEVIRSPGVAQAVAHELSLGDDAEFNGALAPPGLKARILSFLPGEKQIVHLFNVGATFYW